MPPQPPPARRATKSGHQQELFPQSLRYASRLLKPPPAPELIGFTQGCIPKRFLGRPDEALGGGNQGPRPSGVPRGPATSTGSLASQRHPGKFPKVPGFHWGLWGCESQALCLSPRLLSGRCICPEVPSGSHEHCPVAAAVPMLGAGWPLGGGGAVGVPVWRPGGRWGLGIPPHLPQGVPTARHPGTWPAGAVRVWCVGSHVPPTFLLWSGSLPGCPWVLYCLRTMRRQRGRRAPHCCLHRPCCKKSLVQRP